nr:hypothetical protein [Tanacetum cinerariifolium]
MPYRIYKTLGREEMKKIDRGITMMNHTQATLGTHDGEAGSSRSKCPRQHETVEEVLLPQVHHEFLLWEGCSQDAKSRDLNTKMLRDLIDSDGKLIPEDPQLGVPRVSIPKPPRASMWDLYNRRGRMEIRQEAIEHMKYRQSYHWDMYHGVFEHMAGVYSVPLHGAYYPPGYAQP